MSNEEPHVAQAQPLRGVAIADSFRIQAVDAIAEQTAGHDFREQLRGERGLPGDVSLLHPDRPKFGPGPIPFQPSLGGFGRGFPGRGGPPGEGFPGRGGPPFHGPPGNQGQFPPGPRPAPQQPLPPGPPPLGPQQPSPPPATPAPPKPSPPPARDPPPGPPTSTGVEPGSLGIGLSKFVGEFQGNGFNTILRPQNGKAGQGTSDNLLELNFTHETLTFLAEDVLGDVPNRGFDLQPDLNLRGIPYTQRVKDLANGKTGKPDLPIKDAPGIHFEQGLFMRTPALIPWKDKSFTTKVDQPVLGASITRMASIPHGTTINAQCLDPITSTPGAPDFQNLGTPKILPFILGGDPVANALGSNIFPQVGFNNTVTKDRIPLDLKKFADAGTITGTEFNNPENYLKENNDKKKILSHITFQVDTKPRLDLWGGGTDNIAQLAEREVKSPQTGEVITHDATKPDANGNKASTANANAIHVTCRYWISNVEDEITIPVYDRATLPRINRAPELREDSDNIVWPVSSPAAKEGVRKPTFKITMDKNPTEVRAAVVYTQIQYSQDVTLNFGTLSWPHISVATLVPSTPVLISSSKDFRKL